MCADEVYSDSYSGHRSADGLTHRDAIRLKATQAEDVDSEIIGGDPLAMKWVDAARPAEEVASCHRVKSVLGEGVLTGERLEPGLVDFHHQRVLAATDRTVALGELGNIGLDLEANGAAMATAFVLAHRPTAH